VGGALGDLEVAVIADTGYRGAETPARWWVKNGLHAHATAELAGAAAKWLAAAAGGPFGVWRAPQESSGGVVLPARFVVARWTHDTETNPPGRFVSLHRSPR
jgi:hypothetical protein